MLCWRAKDISKAPVFLVSGMPGSGKSTVAAHFANSMCASGKRCIYFAMEELPQQIIRNMRAVGLDLAKWVDKRLLKFSARRPNLYGLETHLAAMHRDVNDFEPAGIVVDPMSALMSARPRWRRPFHDTSFGRFSQNSRRDRVVH